MGLGRVAGLEGFTTVRQMLFYKLTPESRIRSSVGRGLMTSCEHLLTHSGVTFYIFQGT